MTNITYVQFDGNSITVEVENGQSVMQGAVNHAISGIEADCGGEQVCGTCKVIVDDEWAEAVGLPGDEETAVLEFSDPPKNCRLSCQLKVHPDLDGLVVHLPESQD